MGIRRVARGLNGQYTMEMAVTMSAVAVAVILMAIYVRNALQANVKSTEMQLNGGMFDNRP